MKVIVKYLSIFIFALFVIIISNTNNIFVTKIYAENIAALKDSTKKIDNGIGPIKKLKLGPIDKKLAEKGQDYFDKNCIACHNLDKKLIGPPLRYIARDSSPLFIMNYLLNTTEMQKKNSDIMAQIKANKGVIMPNQHLTKKQARELLEYFRTAAISKKI